MKNIKLIRFFALLLLSIAFLSSCADNDSQNNDNEVPEKTPEISQPTEQDQNETPETEPRETTQTGYLHGQVQRACIYYDGVVWVWDSYNSSAQRLKELPEDFTFIGKTLYEDSYEVPGEDFHTSHIEVGLNVYIGPLRDAVYIDSQREPNEYCRYVPIDIRELS